MFIGLDAGHTLTQIGIDLPQEKNCLTGQIDLCRDGRFIISAQDRAKNAIASSSVGRFVSKGRANISFIATRDACSDAT
jgi:hypothetical protein